MQQELGTQGRDSQAESAEDLAALSAESALIQSEQERAVANRALMVSYHTFAARARDCASLARFCMDALESAWRGRCRGAWAWIEPGLGLESGFVFGKSEEGKLLALFAEAKRERRTFLTDDQAGPELCVVPVFGLAPRSGVIGMLTFSVTAGAELGTRQLGTGDVIGLLAGMHVDRLARIDAQRLEVRIAAAAAKAQRMLAEPRERPDALRLAVRALGEAGLDVVAVGRQGGELVVLDSAGDCVPDEAIESASKAIEANAVVWVSENCLALPVGGAGRAAGVLMVRNPSPIGVLNEDMMGGIASAVNASVARYEIARELDDLRRGTTRQLIDAQERERAIIAGEIHDGVIQQLSAVAMRLELGLLHAERGDPESALGVVRNEAAEVRQSTRELRELLADLRPQVIDDHGLEPALLELTSRLEGSNAKLEFEMSADPEGEVSIAIYRLVQEALTNVQKHARAQSVVVSVLEQDDHLLITIEDDGVGMVVAAPGPTATGRHYGVLGMRERARMLGGEFSVGAGDSKGTIVRVTLPRG